MQSESLNWTLLAVEGPLFRTVMTYVALVPANTVPGATVLETTSTSALGCTVTVAVAELLPEFGSPSVVDLMVAVLVNVPLKSGRLTLMVNMTVCPTGRDPPVWVKVTVEPVVQLNVAVEAVEIPTAITVLPGRPVT